MSDYYLLVSAFVFLFCFLLTRNKPPIFGIYQQKKRTYWFKFIFMYVLLKARQLKLYLIRLPPDLKSEGIIHVQEKDINVEKCYDLGHHNKSVDAVYFNGMSDNGEAVICSLARRPQRTCDSFLYLKLDGEDVLLSPNHPDTYLKKSSEDGEEYELQGLSMSNIIPMRSWKLTYNGEMKPRGDETKKIKIEAKLIWSALSHPFDFKTEISAWSMADSMAKEYWSADYFKLLKQHYQTHYEQVGYISGTVVVDGKNHKIHMPCMKDHSFGTLRDWRSIHRYVYHFIFINNGDFIAVGSVSQPGLFSHLIIGYYYCKSDQSMTPVESSDFRLYQHGENQIIPKDYGLSFKAGGKTYAVKVQETDGVSFYAGKDRDARAYEKWCNVEVNGINGRACVEWLYNNVVPK